MAGAFQTLGLGEGRKLGTPAGDLERQARRLRRKGYDRESGPLMAQAAILRAQNRGIQSSEEITERARVEQAAAQDLVRQKEAVVLGAGTPPTTPATTGSAPPSPTTPATTPPSPTAPTGQTTVPTGQSMIPEARRSFAQIASDRQRELTLAGNFGEAAKARAERGLNLEQRQSLFAEMRKAGVKSALDGDFIDRAKALGVDERGFDAALDRLNPETVTAPSPAAPPVGRALAQKNIAEKGFQGAAADYFKRSAAEEIARQAKTLDTAMTSPVAYRSSVPTGTAQRGAPVAAGTTRPQIGQAAPRPDAPSAPVSVIPQFDDEEDFGGEVALKNGGRSRMIGNYKVTPTPFAREDIVDIGKPFAIAGQKLEASIGEGISRFRQEEKKGYKTPLRSATLAGIFGAKSLIGEIRGKK